MTKLHDERAVALRDALAAIERQFGKGAIMTLDAPAAPATPMIPTGSLGLDRALGIGGWPRGRVVEVYGPASSGKTTLGLHAIAECQKLDGVAAFIDAEHALDVSYAQNLGVKLAELLVSQPDCGEQALEIADTLVGSGAVDLVVVDSISALTPRAEIEGELGQQHMGLQARLMSQAMRKLTGGVHRQGSLVMFLNPSRQKVGVVYGEATTVGSAALKFYASVRVEIQRGASIEGDDETVGFRARVKVVKNKLAPPFRQAEFDVLHGKGVWRAAEALDLGVEAGLVIRSGAHYALAGSDDKLGQGREAAARALEETPVKLEALCAALRLKCGRAAS